MRKRLIALLPFFVRYVCIGGFVFVLDIGSFKVLIDHGVYRPLATTLSYILAISTHFSLNRVLNFRNFDRPGSSQLRTYLVVSGFSYVITMIVIEASVQGLGMKPIYAKVLAVAINIPIGFLGHKLFTFGPGLRFWLRRLLGRSNPASPLADNVSCSEHPRVLQVAPPGPVSCAASAHRRNSPDARRPEDPLHGAARMCQDPGAHASTPS